jgi:alkanesulfonate monooxygenase
MARLGRNPDHRKILPGAFVVVGETMAEACEKQARRDSLVRSAIASLSIALGHDVSGFDPDEPLLQIPESNASKSGREGVIDLAQRANLTVLGLPRPANHFSNSLSSKFGAQADSVNSTYETRPRVIQKRLNRL